MTTLPVHAPLARSRVTQAGTRPARTLAGYLLVPRPKDLVKAVIAPLAFVVGALTQGGVSAGQLAPAVLVWAALELLVYQARYQWNDVRGFAADQAHPEAASRGRLPGPLEKARPHITASLAVAVLRLALTALLALALPQLAGVLVAMTVGVLGAAAVYERLRGAATGRTSQVPVPLRPALVALWVWVGAGYAVRGLTGLAMAVPSMDRPRLVVFAGLTMWAVGVVFVTCRWALESMCFGAVENDRLVWRMRPDQAREHTLGLVRWLPPDAVPPAGTTPCGWRALQGRTPLTAPWHLALVVAGCAAAVTGRLLVGADGLLIAGSAGALAALLVAAAPGRRRLATAVGTLLLVAVTAFDRPLAVLPWLVAMALYGCFTRQCTDEVGQPLRRLQPLLHR